ncbi:MAG: bifunctional hydroxymethylpyrimidine kinase/phosphomethylpyrimidine kinase [Candidatus Eiseniibacteriota bacterium]
MPSRQPLALTIAGSDPSGGAGLQADVATFAACGCRAAAVVTAITVQDGRRILAWEPVREALVRDQLRAVLGSPGPAAVKTGMLGTAAVVRIVAAELRASPAPLVCDPVMVSSSGHALLEVDAFDVLREELLPMCALITPNAQEAAVLAGVDVRNPDGAERAGRALLARGARAVLVKGGHFESERGTDVLVKPDSVRRMPAEWLGPGDVHGTGCVLSAAITAYLARGVSLEEAVTLGKRHVTGWIRAATGG